MKTELLSFQKGNAKLGDEIHTFSLPAGYTCPGASQCLAYSDQATGKIKDGKDQLFRCFAASDESRYPSVRESRWRNFNLLRKAGSRSEMANLIHASIPKKAKVVRIHVGGDFFSEDYFLAWCDAALRHQLVRFYAYTKSLHIWRRWSHHIPDNLILTASLGGKYDEYSVGLKTARVVYTEEQAAALSLEIDHDDRHAYEGTDSFALLIHGTQKSGTAAAAALRDLRAAGITGYSKTQNA